MKEKRESIWNQKATDPLLLRAHRILESYAVATGAQICITDQNYLSIPEVYDEMTTIKNTCLYCMKCQYNITVHKNQDLIFHHPCRELHIEAIKKVHETGAYHCYKCELGFMFWISPLYNGKNFIGTFISSGFLCADMEETAEKMEAMCRNTIGRQEILKLLSLFPQANPQKIRALAEIMQVCAESLTQDKNDFNETLKRRGEQQKELTAILETLRGKYGGSADKNSPEKNFPEYPLDREKEFLEAVRSGDIKKGSRILNELLGIIIFISAEQFENVKFRILELAILLSRTDNLNGNVSYAYSNTAHHYLKSIEKAEDPRELIDIIHLMTQFMAGEAFSFRGIQHVSVLKKADRYIQANFNRKLSLREIAAASGLSAPYFSTIFKEEMGENLSSYLNRLRVEKSCSLLIDTHQSLNEIAYACGFKDQSWFSKIFRNYIGMNPAKYRQNKKISSLEINEYKMPVA